MPTPSAIEVLLNPGYRKQEDPKWSEVSVQARLTLNTKGNGPTVVLDAQYKEPTDGQKRDLIVPGVDLFPSAEETKRRLGITADDTSEQVSAADTLQIETFCTNAKPLTDAIVNATRQTSESADQSRQNREKAKKTIDFLTQKIVEDVSAGSNNPTTSGGNADLRQRYADRLAQAKEECTQSNEQMDATSRGSIARDYAFQRVFVCYEAAIKYFSDNEEQGTVSQLRERKQHLVNLASTVCPEDIPIVSDVCDSQIDRFLERFSKAKANIHDQRREIAAASIVSRQRGWQHQLAEFDALSQGHDANTAAAHYFAESSKKQGTFVNKYQSYHKAVDGMPKTAEDWQDIWSSPDYQVGSLDLRTAILHPTDDDDGLTRAEILQVPIFSLDGRTSWAPVEPHTSQIKGPPFIRPAVKAWHFMDERGVLPIEYALNTWKKTLDQNASTDHQTNDNAHLVAEFDTSDAATSQVAGRESRKAYVERARKALASHVMRTQGPRAIATAFSDISRITRSAFETYFDRERLKAEPGTEEEESMLADWRSYGLKTVDERQAAVLSSVHDILASRTEGDESMAHNKGADRLAIDGWNMGLDSSDVKNSLEDRLTQRYGSSRIPTGGEGWKARFMPKNQGKELDPDVYLSEAPLSIREEAVAGLKTSDYEQSEEPNRASAKSGGIPFSEQRVSLI
ncbi:hypothetical protein I316_04703 [Kwoniella heveanensis BCC8398]|uniref:Uncharacterized protein n=1 Tax=Kwoniella heveanensis BCC8398 TaxID=1296120 RepID=A0A1B9GRC4_9TREE|nr:hypothetical protein I316_04703 [Kwoniella heveanensis BCC8398]